MHQRTIAAILSLGALLAIGLVVSVDTRPKSPAILVPIARAQIQAFHAALETYHRDAGHYPSTEEGLAALRVQPRSAPNWRGPYLSKDVPLDPWGEAYVYTYPGKSGSTPEIVSPGASAK